MKVVSYLKGIPGNNKNPEKPEIIKRFIQGVNLCGDTGIVHDGSTWIQSDVAVVQGYVHESSPNSPHLRLRKQVLDSQLKIGKKTIIVDSNLFLYADTNNINHFLRYSLDGVFPSTGNYFDEIIDPSRWDKIKTSLNIKLKPWNKKGTGNHILICLQRNGGWSMKGLDTWAWLEMCITDLRNHTDRPIIVRGHPGDKNSKRIIVSRKYPNNIPLENVHFSDINSRSLKQDLSHAWATVVYNSSPSVASAIEGVPVFVYDPIDCQAKEVSNTDITKIESPDYFEREKWLQKLSMSHWNFEELSNGDAWKHMRNFV